MTRNQHTAAALLFYLLSVVAGLSATHNLAEDGLSFWSVITPTIAAIGLLYMGMVNSDKAKGR